MESARQRSLEREASNEYDPTDDAEARKPCPVISYELLAASGRGMPTATSRLSIVASIGSRSLCRAAGRERDVCSLNPPERAVRRRLDISVSTLPRRWRRTRRPDIDAHRAPPRVYLHPTTWREYLPDATKTGSGRRMLSLQELESDGHRDNFWAAFSASPTIRIPPKCPGYRQFEPLSACRIRHGSLLAQLRDARARKAVYNVID